MFSSNQKSSVQPRKGGITFGKPARGIYNDASTHYATSNFTRSSHRTNQTFSYTKPSYLSKGTVNALANISGNGLKRKYEPENTGNDTLPKRSKYLTISTDSSVVPQVILRKGCTVELRGIHKWMNTIAQLNSHFSEYGRLMDIKVCYQGDPGAATITFSNHAEASVAQRSTNMGFRNGSWSFKAPYSATVPYSSDRRGTYKMPPADMAKHEFIRKEENKVDDLQKRKQELLEQYSKQLKALKDIVTKCGPNDPAREEKLNMIRRLMSSMENVQGSVSIAGVRDQVKVHTEGKSKVPDIPIGQKDNAGIVHMPPPNNQLSAGESKVPTDKKQRLNFVCSPIKVGDGNIEGQQEKSSPKLSAKLDDIDVVHISSKPDNNSSGSSGIICDKSCLSVDKAANIEQLDIGQTTAKNILDYSALDYEYEYPDLSGDWE